MGTMPDSLDLKRILNPNHRSLSKVKKVVLIDDMEFESLRAAAKYFKVEASTLSGYIKKKKPYKGKLIRFKEN